MSGDTVSSGEAGTVEVSSGEADTVEVSSWAVLVNPEGQHGLFPAGQPAPSGWWPAGCTGTEDECMAYVDEHWPDLRPESLRRAMAGRTGPVAPEPPR